MISTCSSVPADAPLAPTASALHRLHRGVCLLETGLSGIRRHVWHLSKTKFEQIRDGVAGAGARGPAAEGAPWRGRRGGGAAELGRRRVGVPRSHRHREGRCRFKAELTALCCLCADAGHRRRQRGRVRGLAGAVVDLRTLGCEAAERGSGGAPRCREAACKGCSWWRLASSAPVIWPKRSR